jgi:protein-disulfide isomerase
MHSKLMLFILSMLAGTILIVFIIVVIPKQSLQKQVIESVPEKLTEPPVSFIDPIRGNPKANITIIEYGDFACPLCKTLEPELVAVIEEAPNKRRLIWKDAPNDASHPNSFVASMAARCAQNQGNFWGMHDLLIQQGVGLGAESIKNMAIEAGLDEARFDTCMSSEATRPVVEHTLEEAISLDISGTPTIYINGVEYSGPLTREGLNLAIEAL